MQGAGEHMHACTAAATHHEGHPGDGEGVVHHGVLQGPGGRMWQCVCVVGLADRTSQQGAAAPKAALASRSAVPVHPMRGCPHPPAASAACCGAAEPAAEPASPSTPGGSAGQQRERMAGTRLSCRASVRLIGNHFQRKANKMPCPPVLPPVPAPPRHSTACTASDPSTPQHSTARHSMHSTCLVRVHDTLEEVWDEEEGGPGQGQQRDNLPHQLRGADGGHEGAEPARSERPKAQRNRTTIDYQSERA